MTMSFKIFQNIVLLFLVGCGNVDNSNLDITSNKKNKMKLDETFILSINEVFDSIKIHNRDKIIYETKKNDSQSIHIELDKFRLGKNNIKVISYYKNNIKSKDINFPGKYYTKEIKVCSAIPKDKSFSNQSAIDTVKGVVGFDWSKYHTENSNSILVEHKAITTPIKVMIAATNLAVGNKNQANINEYKLAEIEVTFENNEEAEKKINEVKNQIKKIEIEESEFETPEMEKERIKRAASKKLSRVDDLKNKLLETFPE